MQTFYLNNDDVRLYFRNLDRRSEDDEFVEILTILKKNYCSVGVMHICPDCDIIECEIKGISFDVICTIDGDGTFIYCEDKMGMRYLETMFEEF